MKMLSWWRNLKLETKLHLLLMTSILVILTTAQFWIQDKFHEQAKYEAEKRAHTIADGVINGLNMLMINGAISNPDNRRLFIGKMDDTAGIKELRIVRADQVKKQFGEGLPEEQPKDELDKLVLATGKEEFREITDKNGKKELRVVVPFIASSSFRGTNCLSCHHVEENSVNGVASIVIDMEEEGNFIDNLSILLWTGQLGIQVVLFITIALVMGSMVFRPLNRMEATVQRILRERNMGTSAYPTSHDTLDVLSMELNNLFASLTNLDTKGQMTLLNKMFEYTNEGIIITNINGIIEAVNQTFTDITGYTADESIGMNPRMLQSGKHDKEFYRELWKSLIENGQWQGEIWNKRKNGEIYPEWLSISSIKNEGGRITHYIAMFSDISIRKQHEEIISYQAYHDALTGLPNRVLFFEKLTAALSYAVSTKQMLAVLFIDLDRFKVINDTLGHEIGDRLLQDVASRLKGCIDENDTLARMGGDEFTVLLTKTSNIEEIILIVEKIINSLKPVFLSANGQELYITPSIGISIYPTDGKDAQTLLKNADTAMYRAKEHGRNNYQLFTPSMNVKAFERLLLENNLRQALNKEQFLLYYQPQIDTNTGRITGIEALLRWNHAEMGIVYPDEFISLAEETGLILPISEWVMKNACMQNKQLQDMGFEPVVMSINLSALQFRQKNLVTLLDNVLKESGLDPSYLELEITETIAMQDVEHSIGMLKELRQLGVRIAIDDFGTGYSSLNYLKLFPIDKLKIDQSFVKDITTNMDSASIVTAIIAIAHNLKLKVIAEGVETEEQFAFLQKHQCEKVQGYYFYRALPPEELIKVLKNNKYPDNIA